MFYQQGDVLLIPTKVKGVTEKGNILAEGELTGHAHRCDGQGTVYENNIFESKGSIITHEEHKPIEIPAGNYEIKIVQEWDYDEEEIREVRD